MHKITAHDDNKSIVALCKVLDSAVGKLMLLTVGTCRIESIVCDAVFHVEIAAVGVVDILCGLSEHLLSGFLGDDSVYTYYKSADKSSDEPVNLRINKAFFDCESERDHDENNSDPNNNLFGIDVVLDIESVIKGVHVK